MMMPLFLFFLSIFFHGGATQNQVNILVTTTVRQGLDDLRITCSASGSYANILSYSINKNDSSPTLKNIVRTTYVIGGTPPLTTTWGDTNVQSRATLSGNPLPNGDATLVMTIASDQVAFPADAGGYQCQFNAVQSSGNAPIQTSAQEEVVITRATQNQVNILVTTTVRQELDDLRITCSASGSYANILQYIIKKNDSSPTLKTIVTTTYVIGGTPPLTTTWGDTNLQTRATLSGNPLPNGDATLIMTIPRDEVACPADAGGYQCQFNAVQSSGNAPIKTSAQEEVVITTIPSIMNQMTVLADIGSGNVPVTTYRFTVGTLLILQCTGQVGNPVQTPRWCHKKTSDFGWQLPASGVSYGEATLVGCQNSMTTTYVHNVTADDNSRTFLCEAGTNPQCGFGDISSDITIFIDPSVEPSRRPDVEKCSSTSETRGNIMFGVGLCLFLLSMGLFTAIFIRHKLESKRKSKEKVYESASPTVPAAGIADHNYSTLGIQDNYVTVT